MSFLFSSGLRSTIPDSGLFRFSFDAATIDNSADAVTDVWNDRTATITGETVVSGIASTYDSGDAVEFDGSTGGITLDSAISNQTALTIGGWFEFDQLQRDQGGFSIGANNGLLIQENSGNIQAFVNTSGGFNSNFNNISISADTPVFVAVGVDTGLGEARWWVNGDRKSTVSVSESVGYQSNDKIGIENDGTLIDGAVDDIQGYTKLPSDTEVSNWYNNGRIDA